MDTRTIPVLDKGYVRLTRIMAEIGEDGALTPVSDLTPANDAKVSFAREAQEFGPGEARLVGFLGREDHTSPFRGAIVQFEVKAPMMVRWQWMKYLIGADHEEAFRDVFHQWNEVSRRYVVTEPEFYIPSEWRSAPENRKQGSGAAVDTKVSAAGSGALRLHVADAVASYNAALEAGVCGEMARLFLPAYAMYTTWRWTASLQCVCHFLKQRLPHDAQVEIQDYARAVRQLIEPLFPVSVPALLGEQ